jgi:hypothetical protein
MSNVLKITLQPNPDFTLIALITSEPIYRLGYLLNESLHLEFREYKTLQIYHPKKQEVQEFSIFRHLKQEPLVNFELIQNKGKNGLLVEEQKQVDYWLKFDSTVNNASKIFNKIKAIKEISLAFEVKPGSLKSKERFIFTFDE